MGIFGAIASTANGFRAIPPGALPPAPVDTAAPSLRPAAVESQSPNTPAVPVAAPSPRRPLTGALSLEAGEIGARRTGALQRNAVLQDVSTLFSPPENDLGAAFNKFVEGWAAFSGNPDNPETGRNLIKHGEALAGAIRTLSAGTEEISTRLSASTAAGVDELNRTLVDIHLENRAIVSRVALDRDTGDLEAKRDGLVSRVVELTGANLFPRENKGASLVTPGGQVLLDEHPTRFTAPGQPPDPASPGAVPAEGAITGGRLGALLAMSTDGSRSTPPRKAAADPGSEIVRKLRSQLDAATNTLLGRSRINQPASFADAYDSVVPKSADALGSGFFLGDNRLTVAVNPALLNGSRTLKDNAAPNVLSSLTATNRQFITDGFTISGFGYSGLLKAVTAQWTGVADNANVEAQVAVAADSLMTRRRERPGPVDLPGEVTRLQQLQTALGSTGRIGHSLGEFLGAIGGTAA
ncbi:MAG: hypothetical protein WCF85_04475 [Rhodospirillaceae bacterium]